MKAQIKNQLSAVAKHSFSLLLIAVLFIYTFSNASMNGIFKKGSSSESSVMIANIADDTNNVKYNIKDSMLAKFIRYVKIDTRSDESSPTNPSTKKQFDLARILQKELIEMGMQDVNLDSNCYLTATLKANTDRNIPSIGFISHIDTSPEVSDSNVKPQIHYYTGGDIVINKKENVVLSVKEFPELNNYIGKTIITSDGTTLLGGDDKAGIAEIMTAMEYLLKHPEIKHGTIHVAFTRDEEIGRGVDNFNVKAFNAKFAYTVDGGPLGNIVYETFNAAIAKIIFNGRNTHPGDAKDRMINSMKHAMEFNSMLPANECPEFTQGYEGFYHLLKIDGNVSGTESQYLIRDHDSAKFEAKKIFIQQIVDYMNKKYGTNAVVLDLKDQYYNMRKQIEKNMYIVDSLKMAMILVGVKPVVVAARGGTDGSRLSYMGLPCPDIFTGVLGEHSKCEFVPLESMEAASKVVIKIVELFAQKK